MTICTLCQHASPADEPKHLKGCPENTRSYEARNKAMIKWRDGFRDCLKGNGPQSAHPTYELGFRYEEQHCEAQEPACVVIQISDPYDRKYPPRSAALRIADPYSHKLGPAKRKSAA